MTQIFIYSHALSLLRHEASPTRDKLPLGAVVLNRVDHPSFPNSIAGVIYQNGAFTAIVDGQFDEPISSQSYQAARDALNGWDPSRRHLLL